ncbi:hypothetical protein [Maridesulfovibrio frigidus]|uniref:hypothetical protein n=1 Tax=Maridesulfovibrio frigidus TaxID=340956 RepID=UPI0004E1EBAB|nr:hypothetical protein [Maridesulfovibrio frigidus]
MIFEIDSSISDFLKNETGNRDLTMKCLKKVEALLLNASDGKNVIFFEDIEIIESLIDCGKFSEPTGYFLEYLRENFASTGSFIELTSRHIKIVLECEPEIIINDKNHTVVTLPIFKLDQSFFGKSVLLTENLVDGKFYKRMTQCYCKNYGQNIDFDFELKHGGGNSTGTVFKETFNNQDKNCLCIVDSDKSHPECNFKETAKSVLDEHNNSDLAKFISDFYILEVKEAENLIPTEVIEKVIDPQQTDNFNTYKSLSNEGAQFFDCKKGINRRSFSKNRDQLHLEFWRKELEGIDPNANDFLSQIANKPAGCMTNCTGCLNRNCKQPYCGGIGSKILDNSIDIINNDEQYSLRENIQKEWETIAKKIITWSIVQPEYRFS